MNQQNPPKAESYYQGLNQWLLRAVPAEAVSILEVGCAEGRLGGALKRQRPDRRVYGIEREQVPAREAATNLDRVFELDVEREAPDLPAGTFDCILFGDVLEHLRDPLGAIRRLLPLLRADGTVLCCVPNVQHVSVVSALLRGDFQYQPLGIMDETHVRFFTYASFTKLLLDAGLEPEIVDHVPSPPGVDFMSALQPALRHAGVDPGLAQAYLGSYQYVFRGRKLAWEDDQPEEPMTFVVCVNDEAQLQDNLLASPSLRAGRTVHEVIQIREAPGVGEALEAALAQAAWPMVVLVHQDVYLPAGWVQRFQAQWREAQRRFGDVGLAGLYGARLERAAPDPVVRTGHLVDRYRLLRDGAVPALVDTLDEVVLAMPRETPLRVTPGLGFHMYGSDLGCRARQLGQAVVALDAPVFHNSLLGDELPPAFHRSAARFKEAWRHALPVATNCGLMEAPPPAEAPSPPAPESAGTAYHRWYYDSAVWDRTTWAGVKALKSPADMWNYQEILAERRPSLVIEFGTRFGGGTLYFAGVLRQLGHRARVLSVDVDAATIDPKVRADPDVELLIASSTSQEVADRIRELRAEYPGPVFAILDSDHSRDHVLAELKLLRPLLTRGDYVVVEDSNLNGHPVLPQWGPGPYEALEAYLAEFPGDYVRDQAREAKFGFTFATDGFLVRA